MTDMLPRISDVPFRTHWLPKPDFMRHPVDAFVSPRSIDVPGLKAWLATSPPLGADPPAAMRPTAMGALLDNITRENPPGFGEFDNAAAAVSLLLEAGASPDMPSHINTANGASKALFSPLEQLAYAPQVSPNAFRHLAAASKCLAYEGVFQGLVIHMTASDSSKANIASGLMQDLLATGATPGVHALAWLLKSADLGLDTFIRPRCDAAAASLIAAGASLRNPSDGAWMLPWIARHNYLGELPMPAALAAMAVRAVSMSPSDRESMEGSIRILAATHKPERVLACWRRALLAATPHSHPSPRPRKRA